LKIVYSSYLSAPRRRFTIAHEIAHAIFESSGPRCPRVGKELERLCDMLATEMLMPSDVFLQLVGPRISVQKLFELASVFKTSLSATAIRLAELCGISTFEAEDERILWSYGVVKKGLIMEKSSDLRRAIEASFTVESGVTVMFIHNKVWTGEWKLEWARIGQGRRALFLLEPIRAEPAQFEA
jgi:Zn-dependent peptidase ImmA (M78 family)